MDVTEFTTNKPILPRYGQRDILSHNVTSRNLTSNAAAITTLDPSSYTSNNTANTLVYRNASGNFSANVITASLVGNVTGSASLNENPLTFNAPLSRSVNTISLTYTPLNKAGDTMTGDLTMTDAKNIIFGTTTGTVIGTSTTQKIGFYNATPIVQRSGVSEAAVSTTASTQTTPFGYTTAAQADGIVTLLNEIRATLVALGLFKGSA